MAKIRSPLLKPEKELLVLNLIFKVVCYFCAMGSDSSDFALSIELWLHNELGINQSMTQPLKMIILFVGMLVIAIVLWRIAQYLINRYIKRIVLKTAVSWDDALFKKKTFAKLGHIVPVVIISVLLPVIITDYPGWQAFVDKLMTLFIAFIIIRVFLAVISAANIFLSQSDRYKDKPIASFTQLAKILVWTFGIIIVVAIVVERNPIAILGAMGAVSAVILLIFKDTILGFIASIQLTINDMVRIGDWVSLPNYNTDGDVIEINLTTIKVRNWDKTISTVPTYFFVSDSFKNWRGMTEGGGRRIKRAVHFKVSSIQFCDEEALERYSKVTLVQPHIQSRRAEIEKYNAENNVDTDVSIVNGRRMTNIGIFRAYILQYIRQNPNINLDMTCLVRQLESTNVGVPLQIYCFSRMKSWVKYEEIQSDIFDHILATFPHFDLEVFENPASSDIRNLEWKR